jgi:hypothetical protein
MDEEKKVKRGRPQGSKDLVPRKGRKDLSWDGNENVQPGDRGYYVRHALASWNLPPIDISDAKQVEERIYWYFQHCVEDDLKPTVMGLCNAIGITRATFYNWGVGETRTDSHKDIVTKARDVLEEMWEIYMVEGKINPIVGIFLGKNHYGYTDKKELTIEPRQTIVEPTQMDDVLKLYGGDEGSEDGK